jgi:hypothetical protein
MPKQNMLIVAFTILSGTSSIVWAQTTKPSATLKDIQCRQSVCTTKCDVKGEKCLVSCDDKQANNNCKKSFYRASPFGVLEVAPQRKSP